MSNKNISIHFWPSGVKRDKKYTTEQRIYNATTAVNDVKRFVSNNVWEMFVIVPSITEATIKKKLVNHSINHRSASFDGLLDRQFGIVPAENRLQTDPV